ncbi:ankyrin repeat-containing protein At5g02620-like [Vitis riparia]|uniref:ankyrin repeat-containing protein At5g02620-like n=1 Tax=Vitis riparia TaxID=96939 RepID=UPI00155A8C13|nr:ankyrin repeat-containing protein At5g02620-like [Vitis riparia]
MARTPELHTLNFASKFNQVEDAGQTPISNEDAPQGGSQTKITPEVAGDNISQTEILNQKAAEEVTGSDIRHMDASFYKAAAEGNMKILTDMSQEDMLDKLTQKENTILHVAAQFGQLHYVNEIFLRCGFLSSPLLQPNLKGDTPLHLSAREGHWVVTLVLIEAEKKNSSGSGIGAVKTMLTMTNNEQNTALHEAVRYNHPDVVKSLILEDPDFSYSANSSGGTPLYMAAERGFHELVQIIIDNTTRDSLAYSGLMGRTALHTAVICNNKDMTKKILGSKKGLAKKVDDNGWSPLHCAAYLGYTSIARQLLVSLDKSDEYIVYLPVKNDHNKTTLLIAASRGHTEIVKLLVSQYPDCCEQVDDNGNNAFHLIMIESGIYGGSGLLNFPWMSFRGLMNEKNVEGKTPLHLLADNQMFGCRSFIMHKMVDKMVLDNNNSTPTDIVLSVEDLYGKKVKTTACLPRIRNFLSINGFLYFI